MGRIYMDLSEDQHKRFKNLALNQKRTLKGFLEHIVAEYVLDCPESKEKKGGVKHGKK